MSLADTFDQSGLQGGGLAIKLQRRTLEALERRTLVIGKWKVLRVQKWRRVQKKEGSTRKF